MGDVEPNDEECEWEDDEDDEEDEEEHVSFFYLKRKFCKWILDVHTFTYNLG